MRFEEKQEEPEPEPVEVSKPEPVKRERVDHGRIVALYTANRTPRWTVAEIADDVGCSAKTVINHLKKEGLYK